MSGVSIIMAGVLMHDLQGRGFPQVELRDCEAMVARMLDCAGVIERRISDDDDAPPQRCATNEVDLDGSCMACGAIQGERCRREEAA
ncbi:MULTISPECIES: hypothetical protein [unclassified Bradyrhizobium]|jgi:hypothetical protein|uniref:hypothetical protein n=1 Tax=unclassified Bradyrhizobium TaxID=2631580 RepID=UPI00037F641F|nr:MULTISPECIES: hypothetical protein [unclassified Bradyrhizobium]MCK1432527.1 hypothetical protein [Bradyrhizobium sp. 87]MCK1588023.1 hypothetical protein [Bradyrhizobium sp. 169]MCK1661886.1 hypothetical protein [Bradyrhizobium sp. 151]MCK1707366.1 hypothetical protein [Bradyrhizobium sp. 146]